MFLQKLPNNYFSSIDEFQFPQEIKPLGNGSFGTVRKGVHKMTNKIYAIKIIQITSETTETEKLLLEREIAIHYQLQHPHIVKLWAVLKHQNKVYMILDYAKNGNLFSYHKMIKQFSQSQSFTIFYQILQAIDYMHKRDVFHRDLKPQNMLLDHNNNILLCDFGWVAEDIERKRTTFCGTYEYMSPQMLDGNPYDYRIDIWALGILLYQLNHGRAPFEASSIDGIKEKLRNGCYEIKESLSRDLKELIIQILQFDPEKRLSIKEIKDSGWIKKNRLINSSFKRMKDIQDDTFKPDTRKKPRYHKKYRTLEEEDFADMNCQSKNTKMDLPSDSGKENFNPKIMIDDLKKKKKNSLQSSKNHLRTESNEFFNKKIKEIMMMPGRLKVFQKELKKKKTVKK